MDLEERARLLRQRFRAIGGVALPSDQPRKVRPKWVEHKGPLTFSRAYPYGTARFDTHCQWVREPDAKPVLTPVPKRNQGPHALTRIAAQLPRKLPRVSLPQ